MTLIVRPPWTLNGNGYILVYQLPRKFLLEHGFIPQVRLREFVGGLSLLMLMDYQLSPVGAYQELLFIPGLFRIASRRLFSITKIYVSTEASLVSGRENWAIPKELASFDWTEADEQTRISVSHEDQHILDISLHSAVWSIPFKTGLLPSPKSLVQFRNSQAFLTAPYGDSRVSLAEVTHLSAAPALFPNLSQFWPIVALKARDFNLVFPFAELLNAD